MIHFSVKMANLSARQYRNIIVVPRYKKTLVG